jgi:hypothetical protein
MGEMRHFISSRKMIIILLEGTKASRACPSDQGSLKEKTIKKT